MYNYKKEKYEEEEEADADADADIFSKYESHTMNIIGWDVGLVHDA